MPYETSPIPIPPTTKIRNILGKKRKEMIERIFNKSGFVVPVRYKSTRINAKPNPSKVTPPRMNKYHRFTPNPGVNQRANS